MITKVISGGQTGADRAGLRAARACRIPTGGWAPKGWLTENGPQPELLMKYGLKENASPKYPARTARNIQDSDMTLVIGTKLDKGSGLTIKLCFKLLKPVFNIARCDMEDQLFGDISFKECLSWIKNKKHSIINIAGNRESRSPGIEKAATIFLIELFGEINAYNY